MHNFTVTSILGIIALFALIGLFTNDAITGQAGVRYRWGNMLHTCQEEKDCGPSGFCQKFMGDEKQGQCRGKYNEGTPCYRNVECRSLCCTTTCMATEECFPNFRERIASLHEQLGDKKLVFHTPDSFK